MLHLLFEPFVDGPRTATVKNDFIATRCVEPCSKYDLVVIGKPITFLATRGCGRLLEVTPPHVICCFLTSHKACTTSNHFQMICRKSIWKKLSARQTGSRCRAEVSARKFCIGCAVSS